MPGLIVDKAVPAAIAVVVIVLSLVAMYLGWRARGRRQSSLARPLPVPDQHGETLFRHELLYVATTAAGDPLDRIVVPGLGFRAQASITGTTTGLVLSLDGAREAYIPADALRGIDRASWTIDRAVEKDGLVCVTWMLGESTVDSYFRVVASFDPSDLIEAIQQIMIGAADQEGRL